MPLTPLDIAQQEFKRVLRGLDPNEVRAFLEKVAEEMTRLVKEAGDKDERIQRLEAQVQAFQDRGDSLTNALVTAQRMMEEIKANAKREAELVMKEAELKAERLLEQAHRKLAQVQAEIAELKRQRDLFEAKVRGAVKLHLDLLESQQEKPRAP